MTSQCYLDRPRIHFAGQFRADVSTINNCYDNFATDDFKIVDGTITDKEHARWNPTGTGVFNFHNVAITSVCPQNGPCTTDDPLVSRRVTIDTVLSGGSGKMVDLDVEYLVSSLLYGLKFGISVHDHEGGIANKQAILVGHYHPVGFKGIWSSVTNVQGMTSLSATYQSILQNLTWNDWALNLLYPPGSDQDSHGFLRRLREKSPLALSISFTVYGFDDEAPSDRFTYGYVVGTIGVSGDPSETPIQYVRGRQLDPLLSSTITNTLLTRAEFVLRDTRKALIIDFGNSLKRYKNETTKQIHLDTNVMGKRLCMTSRNGHELGRVNLTDEWYVRTAGVVEVDLTHDTGGYDGLCTSPLQVVNCSDSSIVFLSESYYHVRPMGDVFSFMDPGEKISQKFFVTHMGYPVANHKISFAVAPYHARTMCSQLDPDKRGSQSRCNCNYTMTADENTRASHGLMVNEQTDWTVYTDTNGEVSITLTAGDPGKVRKYVDGLVYLVSYLPTTSFDSQSYPDAPLVVRVFDTFTWEGEPTWYGKNGVRSILQQYDNLYPTMRHILNLGDYDSVIDGDNIRHLNFSLRAERTAPGHMPVTRDLSKDKRNMILQWLDQPFPPKKGRKEKCTLEELRKELQLVLQVEFYTIPPYAYALYSIKEGANQEIAKLISRIVVEEMGHLAIVANILNAIGGDPRIFDQNFIPVFPSRLPGGIEPNLVLRLAPLSLDLIRHVFMKIETPTQSYDSIHNDTIGSFYARIRRDMKRLERESNEKNTTIFTGNRTRQVDFMASPVTNLEEALEGIRLIVEQGEGTSQMNPTDEYKELAHYYKFAEIVHGRQLLKQPDGNWEYAGKPHDT